MNVFVAALPDKLKEFEERKELGSTICLDLDLDFDFFSFLIRLYSYYSVSSAA